MQATYYFYICQYSYILRNIQQTLRLYWMIEARYVQLVLAKNKTQDSISTYWANVLQKYWYQYREYYQGALFSLYVIFLNF